MDDEVSKRRFLAYLVAALAAFITTVVGVVVGSASIIPAFRRRDPEWIELTAESGLGAEPKPFSLVRKVEQGWHSAERVDVVFAYKTEEAPVVYSSVCTHLGCGVRWDGSAREFKCPCHGGAFDLSGNAVAGPPTDSLRTLDVKVEGGKILVRQA